MFEDVIFRNLWLVLPIWILVSFLDYFLTIFAARNYKAGANEHILVEGSFELTPFYQKDVDALRLYSPRFLLVTLLVSGILVLFWLGCRTDKDPGDLSFMQFLIGGLILLRLGAIFRNAESLFSFRLHEGISGQIQYKRWRVYRGSANQLFLFAGLFFVLFLFTGSPSLLGGSLLTVLAGHKHLRTFRKLKRADEVVPPPMPGVQIAGAKEEPKGPA